MYQNKRQRQRAHRRRRFIFFLVSSVVLLLGAAAAVYFLVLPAGKAAPVKLAVPQGAPRVYTGSGFLYVGGGALNYANLRDEKKSWTSPMNSENVRLAASAAVSAVYNDSAVQFLDTVSGAQLFKREYIGAIELVRCGTGSVAVLRRDEAQKRQLYILSLKDEELDALEFGSNQEVLDFGFYQNDEMLWTLTLNTGGVSPNCTIETYVVATQSKTGMMTVEGQLIERVEFVDKNTFTVGTNHILSYNELGQIAERTLIYGWKAVDFGIIAGKPSFIVTPRGQTTGGTAKLITLPAQETLLQLPASTKGIFITGGKYVVITGGSVLFYSDKGEKTREQTLEITVDAAEKISPTQLLLTQGTELFLLDIG